MSAAEELLDVEVDFEDASGFPGNDPDVVEMSEADRSMLETVGLYGDEGWEAVAAAFPLTWRTLHTVPQPRAAFEHLRAQGLVATGGGKISLTADGQWVLRVMR